MELILTAKNKMPVKTVVEQFILLLFPPLTAFLTALFGGGFLSALILAAVVKIVLYFFTKEIKKFSMWLRKNYEKIKNTRTLKTIEMKNNIFKIKVFSTVAIVMGLVMAILGMYESWSQHAGTVHDPMLYATLFCISSAFLVSNSNHPFKEREITKIFGISYKLKHAHMAIALFFGGVIVFSVNNSIWWVETLHLLFTGLAIGTGYITLLIYPETKKGHTWALVGFIIGVSGFLLAYLFHIYSIAWGEVIAAFPLIVWMYITLKIKTESFL